MAALSLIVIFSLRSAGIDLKDLLALRGRFLGYVERNAAVSAAAFIITYILVVALSIPGATVLTLLGGFLFGPALGVILVNLGATTGAFLVFLAARYLLRDSLMEKYVSSSQGSTGNSRSTEPVTCLPCGSFRCFHSF